MSCVQSFLSVSECARILLAACNSGDSRTIQDAISLAHTVRSAALTGADAERLELVREASLVIGGWMHGHKSTADRDASLMVLRHMVRSDRLQTACATLTAYGSSST